MQRGQCQVANYRYVHYLWKSVRGDSEHFDIWLFLEIKAICSEQ